MASNYKWETWHDAKKGTIDTSDKYTTKGTGTKDGAEYIAVCHHGLQMILWYADGRIKLDNHGYWDEPTRKLISKYAPISVDSSNYSWVLEDGTIFYNGIEL
jgi:hypothetical protein